MRAWHGAVCSLRDVVAPQVEDYTRSWEEDEVLGLHDIQTEGYEQNEVEGGAAAAAAAPAAAEAGTATDSGAAASSEVAVTSEAAATDKDVAAASTAADETA